MTAYSTRLGTERLTQLSQEVRRIARELERISAQESADRAVPVEEDIPDVPLASVLALIRARQARTEFLPQDVFAEPAWDMMLDLLKAEIDGEEISVSSLCIASGVPPTTALRLIGVMVEKGYFVRTQDPKDRRRILISLTPETSRSLRRYFVNALPHIARLIRE